MRSGCFGAKSVGVALFGWILIALSTTSCLAEERHKPPPSGTRYGVPVAPGKRPPNILLIIADDVGVDQVQAYGEDPSSARTPNIDALASRGVLFRNVWSNPVCSSTRATILTGRYGFRTGVGFVARAGADLRDRETTLAELLLRHPRTAYGTAAFGKWHLTAGRSWETDDRRLAAPLRAGFTVYRGVFKNILESYVHWHEVSATKLASGKLSVSGGQFNSSYNTSEIVDQTGRWIRQVEARRPEAPWFVWLAFNAAHPPFHRPPSGLHRRDLGDPALTCRNPPPFEQPENLRPCYQAMIEAMDTEIGRLLDHELSSRSLARTTVIFVGDNGSVKEAMTDPRVAVRAKGTPYERGINVPLVVAGAGVGSDIGRESDVLVNTTDLFATVLELAGIDPERRVPAELSDGRAVVLDSTSLVPVLGSSGVTAASHARRFAYAELFQRGRPDPLWPVARTVRDVHGYKLIEFLDGRRREEFYDLSRDPFEQNNLLGLDLDAGSAAAFEALRARLDDMKASGWRPQGPPLESVPPTRF